MTYNDGIFTVSDLGGSDPHAFWVTGLPSQAQPQHHWETPQQDWLTHDNQLLLHQALIDAQIERAERDAARLAEEEALYGKPYQVADDPRTWGRPTYEEHQDLVRWRCFQIEHPFLAVRMAGKRAPFIELTNAWQQLDLFHPFMAHMLRRWIERRQQQVAQAEA